MEIEAEGVPAVTGSSVSADQSINQPEKEQQK
jgi:hypothetical protein